MLKKEKNVPTQDFKVTVFVTVWERLIMNILPK